MKKRIKLADRNVDIDTAILHSRAVDPETNPDIAETVWVVLHDTQKVHKKASYFTIRSRHSGEIKHHALKLQTILKLKDGYYLDDGHSITLTDEDRDNDEIAGLYDFLSTKSHVSERGDYFLIHVDGVKDDELVRILDAIGTSDKISLLSKVLSLSDHDPQIIEGLVELASQNPAQSKSLITALNIGRFTTAISELKRLITENAPERQFQGLLQENSWIFGSEYNERLEKRSIWADEETDFLLKRTADDYVEVIEIKTPLRGQPLFIRDRDHDSLYQCAELSKAVAQVIKYIDTLEQIQDNVQARYGFNLNGISAKIIIGRDGDVEQIAALRRLNTHLHRIEVITYDQLIRIAERTINVLQEGDF